MSYPSLPIYPDIITGIPGVIPFDYTAAQPILKTDFASGKEVRRQIWSSPRRNVTIYYKRLTEGQALSFWEFYRSMNGPFTSFSFFFPKQRTYYDEAFGTSTGSETVINLPCKGLQDSESFKLRRGNVSLTSPYEYVLSFGTGPDGGDQAFLSNSGSKGQVYFFSFTGRLRIKARFDDKSVGFSEEKGIASDMTVKLIGLQSELT